jgi:uncharacterized SAM-binding protein YcdF (DUF218 family)
MSDRRLFLGLFQRRECVVPTWRGLLLGIVLTVALASFVIRNAEPFLAVTEPSPGGALVIEGWASDFTMAQAIGEFQRHPYAAFLVTGGPIEKGAVFSEFKTYAEFGEATLEKFGIPADQVHSVPAPEVEKDRTYASALALKEWLQSHNLPTNNVNLLTMGIHARRSRMLFERAFGPGTTIGITALKEPDANAKPWWKTSAGVRGMIAEVLAYIYARFLFNPNGI